MTPTEPHDTFHRRQGEILGISLNVEICLEDFISFYFFRMQTKKIRVFNNLILYKITFDRKISLFEEICKHEKIYDKIIRDTIKTMNYVRETRNKVAHFASSYLQQSDDPKSAKILLRNRKSRLDVEKNGLDITEELVQDIGKDYFSIMKEVIEAQNRLIEKEKKNNKSEINSSTPQSFL